MRMFKVNKAVKFPESSFYTHNEQMQQRCIKESVYCGQTLRAALRLRSTGQVQLMNLCVDMRHLRESAALHQTKSPRVQELFICFRDRLTTCARL